MKKIMMIGVIALAGTLTVGGMANAQTAYPPGPTVPPQSVNNTVIDTVKCEYDAAGNIKSATATVWYWAAVKGVTFEVFTNGSKELYYTTTKPEDGHWSYLAKWDGKSSLRSQITGPNNSWVFGYDRPGCAQTSRTAPSTVTIRKDQTLPKTGLGTELTLLGFGLLVIGYSLVRLTRVPTLIEESTTDEQPASGGSVGHLSSGVS